MVKNPSRAGEGNSALLVGMGSDGRRRFLLADWAVAAFLPTYRCQPHFRCMYRFVPTMQCTLSAGETRSPRLLSPWPCWRRSPG